MRMTGSGIWVSPLVALGLIILVGGCTVLPTDEARALRERQGAAFDATKAAGAMWRGKARDAFMARAVPLAALQDGALERMGQEKGHKAGEGSAWTFVIRGSGTVRSIDRDGPQGRVDVDGADGPVSIQIGPLISGTAIRDAIPSIVFDDYPDQIAFAELGMALTDRAVADTRRVLASVRPGDRIGFVGAATVVPGQSVLITPVEVTR